MSEDKNTGGRFSTLPPSSFAMVSRYLIEAQNALLDGSVKKRSQTMNLIGSLKDVNDGIAGLILSSAKQEAKKLETEAYASLATGALSIGLSVGTGIKQKGIAKQSSIDQGNMDRAGTLNRAYADPRGGNLQGGGTQNPSVPARPTRQGEPQPTQAAISDQKSALEQGRIDRVKLEKNGYGYDRLDQTSRNAVDLHKTEGSAPRLRKEFGRQETIYANKVEGHSRDINTTTVRNQMYQQTIQSTFSGIAQMLGAGYVLKKAEFDSAKVQWELSQQFMKENESDFAQRAGENARAGNETISMLNQIVGYNRYS